MSLLRALAEVAWYTVKVWRHDGRQAVAQAFRETR